MPKGIPLTVRFPLLIHAAFLRSCFSLQVYNGQRSLVTVIFARSDSRPAQRQAIRPTPRLLLLSIVIAILAPKSVGLVNCESSAAPTVT